MDTRPNFRSPGSSHNISAKDTVVDVDDGRGTGSETHARATSTPLAYHIKKLLRSTQDDGLPVSKLSPSPDKAKSDRNSTSPELHRNFKQSTKELERGQTESGRTSGLSGRFFPEPDVQKAQMLLPTLQQISAIRTELTERNELLTLELQQVHEENSALRDEISSLESRRLEADHRFRMEARNRTRLEDEIEALIRRGKEREAEFENNSNDLATLKAQLGIVQADLLSCRAEAWEAAQSALDMERNQISSEKNRMKQERENLGILNRQLQEQLGVCDAEIGHYREKLKDATKGWETWEAKSKTMENKLREIQNELQASFDAVQEREKLIRNQQQELEAYRDSTSKLQQELMQAARQETLVRDELNARYATQLKKEAEKASRFEEQAREFEAEWRDASDVCSELKSINAEILMKLARYEEQNAATQYELTRTFEQLKTTAEEKERANRDYSELETSTQQRLQEQANLYHSQIENYLERISESNSTREQVEEKLKYSDQKTQSLQQELKELRAKFGEHDMDAARLLNENKLLSKEVDSLKSELQNRQQSEMSIRQELLQTSRQVSMSKEGHEAERARLKNLLSVESNKCQSLEQEVADLKKEHAVTENRVLQLQSEISKLHLHVESTQDEKTALKADLVRALQISSDYNRDVDLLAKESERMSQDLLRRNAVESDLRKELFHAVAELSRAKDMLAFEHSTATEYRQAPLSRIQETNAMFEGKQSRGAGIDGEVVTVSVSPLRAQATVVSEHSREDLILDSRLISTSSDYRRAHSRPGDQGSSSSSLQSQQFFKSGDETSISPSESVDMRASSGLPFSDTPELPEQTARKRSIVVGISKKWTQH